MPEAELSQFLEELRAIPSPRPADPFMELMARTAAEARALRDSLIPAIQVDVPAPVVNVSAPEVRMDVPDQSAALAALTTMLANVVEALVAKEVSVTVNVPELPAARITVEMPPHLPETKTITVKRNRNGLIESALVTEDQGG